MIAASGICRRLFELNLTRQKVTKSGLETNFSRIQPSAALQLRPSFFWDITRRWYLFIDVSVQPVGSTFKGKAVQAELIILLSLLDPLQIGPMGCPETS